LEVGAIEEGIQLLPEEQELAHPCDAPARNRAIRCAFMERTEGHPAVLGRLLGDEVPLMTDRVGAWCFGHDMPPCAGWRCLCRARRGLNRSSWLSHAHELPESLGSAREYSAAADVGSLTPSRPSPTEAEVSRSDVDGIRFPDAPSGLF